MWKSVSSVIVANANPTAFLTATNILQNQLRTTFILRRKNPTPLAKKDYAPRLKGKHHVYELIKDTNTEKQPDLEVILTEFVEGVGHPGEKVSVRPNFAYNNLLLPGLAVYATPENIDKYGADRPKEQFEYSSVYALLTVKALSRISVSVVMNKDNPWTLKPWHVSTSFRKCGYIVPEETITMPEQPITGPDMNNEGKEFYVIVTINKQEKVNVRCRLHHWSTEITERLPYELEFWNNCNGAILPEQAEVLNTMPKKPPIRKKATNV